MKFNEFPLHPFQPRFEHFFYARMPQGAWWTKGTIEIMYGTRKSGNRDTPDGEEHSSSAAKQRRKKKSIFQIDDLRDAFFDTLLSTQRRWRKSSLCIKNKYPSKNIVIKCSCDLRHSLSLVWLWLLFSFSHWQIDSCWQCIYYTFSVCTSTRAKAVIFGSIFFCFWLLSLLSSSRHLHNCDIRPMYIFGAASAAANERKPMPFISRIRDEMWW